MIKETWKELNKIESGPKQMRRFCMEMGIICLLIAAFVFFKVKKDSWMIFGGAGLIFLLLRYTNPMVIKPFQKFWMGLGIVLGAVVSKVVLAVLYYLVLTPISLIAKVTKHHFLELDMKKNGADSYWIQVPQTPFDKNTLERQF